MVLHRTRPSAESYGHSVGILLLEARLPFIPGDVRNASTFGYPVLYKTVAGLSAADCLRGASEFAGAVTEAARALEGQGVRGITSDCGAMLTFQDAVRDVVQVPVCLSSLLQLPTVARSLDAARPIAVITAHSKNLTHDMLARARLSVPNPIVIRGMEDAAEFKSAVLQEKGTLDSDRITEEAVEVTRQALRDYPDLGAVILECSVLPPYAKAIQDAISVPVYDFITMIDYLQGATHRTRYVGYY